MRISIGVRILLAFAFVIFCCSAAVCWLIAPASLLIPWWIPFAVAAGFPGVAGVAITIIDPSFWRD